MTVTFSMQLAPLASVVPQLSLSAYSPLAVIARLAMAAPVLFVSVAVCGLEVTPTDCALPPAC